MKRANLPPLIAAVAITAVVSLAILSVVGHEAEAGNGTTHTVFVNNSVFCGDADSNCAQPYSIQINPGDTVQWPDGEAGTPHTVTQCSGDGTGCPGGTPGFDSGELTANPPTLYLTQSFPNEGTFFYRCQVHGNSMRGIITVGNPTTPTPSPTPSPSPAPTATATPAPTLSGRSDVNCDGVTDGDDVLALLLHAADAPPAAAASGADGCAPIGSADGDGAKGDLNCDGLVNARDALVALYGWAGLSVPGLPEGCLGP